MTHTVPPRPTGSSGPTTPTAPTATRQLVLADETATAALAARLAAALEPGMVLWLSGGLGAGKTTLVRGVLRALGHTGKVRSPTFTLLEPYNLVRFPVYHFDFYRFSSADEWRDAGFDEYFRGAGACLVEWPELAGPDLPRADLAIRLGFADDDAERTGDARIAQLDAFGDAGLRCLNAAAAAS
ncbi:MAG: tRNA (adenosine(37)-N6)-threonylcarbamoyltransferase complex ATPase subunit type 1 TsaE [Burkholderiales bacterium]|nr:MAG: tRNA (adenosine(37)-N6)-threonylcarbamoyltransferase complex ATPase subunit type 1 TsaE [Burkholderiales bacterium]